MDAYREYKWTHPVFKYVITVIAKDKAEAKDKIQTELNERMESWGRAAAGVAKFYEEQERIEQERIANIDWQALYYRAIEALRHYNPLLADEIEKDRARAFSEDEG